MDPHGRSRPQNKGWSRGSRFGSAIWRDIVTLRHRAAAEDILLTNLFDDIPAFSREEVITNLLARDGVRIERIVSTGQSTPLDAPYDQGQCMKFVSPARP
jgi:hypothetical protein